MYRMRRLVVVVVVVAGSQRARHACYNIGRDTRRTGCIFKRWAPTDIYLLGRQQQHPFSSISNADAYRVRATAIIRRRFLPTDIVCEKKNNNGPTARRTVKKFYSRLTNARFNGIPSGHRYGRDSCCCCCAARPRLVHFDHRVVRYGARRISACASSLVCTGKSLRSLNRATISQTSCVRRRKTILTVDPYVLFAIKARTH